MLGRAFAERRQFDQARRCIGEAIALTEASGERWFDAEIYRIGGEIELGSSEPKGPNAQRYFELALDVARAQQARSLELRAAVSLARLWRGQARRTEARDLLAPVYEGFTEGFDTPDLKEAKALLEELGSQVAL
jgi:predicted ATPase